ncbi:DUF58 domain-containing protein [Specibacter sp. NPDC057265]|uniref:DUF58 domain-containing protein n=1 Tax=Specibacter sp. NPDC057265 TaxID=3346075 RepID=UPI0036401A5D
MRTVPPLRPRGWLLLAVAVLALVAAWVLGRRDLLWLAVFCLALPAVAYAGLHGFKTGFTVRRQLVPRLARVGGAVQFTLEVRGRSPAGTHLQLTEQLPPSFHENPRFSYPSPVVPHGLLSRYQYRAVPSQRGVFTVGPLQGLFSDPFDVALLHRELDGGEQLTVAPAALELAPLALSHGRGQDGSHSSAELAHASADDAMTRHYRPGDPLRRVHWAVTARQGRLMVRAEESVTAPEAALILDQRQLAFGGSARFAFHVAAQAPGRTAQPLRTTAAFEKAVGAAVSIATHLLDRGYTVRVLDHQGGPGFASSPSALQPLMEDFSGPQGVVDVAVALAALELAAAGGPAAFGGDLGHKLHRGRRRGPLVAVVGSLSDAEARLLAGMGESTQWAAALLLCYDPAEAAAALEILRAAGWQAAALSPKSSLAAVWESLGQNHLSGLRP